MLALVPLALAGNGKGHSRGHGWGHGKFQLQATVVSADPATSTPVMLVKAESKQVKSYRGLELTLTLAAGARIFADNGDTTPPLTLVDVFPALWCMSAAQSTAPTRQRPSIWPAT